MKKVFILAAALVCALGARAQGDEGHEGHEGHGGHGGEHGHDAANESPAALFEDMAEAIAAQPGEKVLYSFMGLVPRFGMAVQTGLFAEAGLGLDFYRLGYTGASEYVSFGYSNLRPYVAGEIMVGRRLVGGGKAGVEYIRSTPVVGMALGADASYYTDGDGRDAILVTPRLMFSFVKVEVYYGYNFFVRNELTRWIGHHRVGVSIMLNPRFWRRKARIYEEYYNSYLEE